MEFEGEVRCEIDLPRLRIFGREVNRGFGVRKRWKFWSAVQGSKGYQPRVEKGGVIPVTSDTSIPTTRGVRLTLTIVIPLLGVSISKTPSSGREGVRGME